MAEQPRNLLKREVVGTTAPTATVKKAPSTKGKNELLSDDCVEYLNYRVQQEEYSGRIYLAMSMWLDNNGYVNAAKLWRRYSNEEMSHSDIARTYLLSMGVQPLTPKLDAPNQNFTGLPEIIEMSYDHEIVVTKQIKELAADAMKKADHMLYEFALAYLKEQVEEHNKMQNWVDQLNSFGTDKIAMRLLDHEMKDYL
jgi:ferritin